MSGRRVSGLIATALPVAACASPVSRRGPSRENIEERAGLTARLVESHERRLADVQTRFANGVAPQSDLTAAEIALIDAQLRDLSAQALLELAP